MQHVQDYLKHVKDNLAPFIVKATVPFFVLQDNTLIRCHTGVFLRIGEKHFLLTASHAWKEINLLQLPVFVGWDDEAKRPFQLAGTNIHFADPSTYDVAIATLSPDQAASLKKRFTPLFIRQMCRRDDDEHGLYLMCGCPTEIMQLHGDKHVPSPYLLYLCQKFDGERKANPDADFKFDPQMHCLFNVMRDGLDAMTLSDVRLPNVKGTQGISGCGIWKVGRIEGKSLIRFQPDDVELCAIEHRYNEKSGYAIGTWIERVVEGIIRFHPETKKVFKMYPNFPKW